MASKDAAREASAASFVLVADTAGPRAKDAEGSQGAARAPSFFLPFVLATVFRGRECCAPPRAREE